MTQYPPGQPSPQPLSYATPVAPRADLREIAVRQRYLNYCILAYLGLLVARFVVPPEAMLFVALAAVAVVLTGVVFVFMLAIALYSTAAGILLGILTLIPLLGLLVLLIVNSKATSVLRRHGVRVGLFGADPNQVPAAPPASPQYQQPYQP